MHYLIISCSPQNKDKSTSALLASMIKGGITHNSDDTAEILYINNKSIWQECRNSFYKNRNIIFCIPLYVEGIPGLLMEFLETLHRKELEGTKLSFVIQGGFEEACQLRTAEHFLQSLPPYLNCEYCGTLLKGGLFGMATMRSQKYREKMQCKFIQIMKEYKKSNSFDNMISKKFCGVEFYSQGMIILTKLAKPINRLVWNVMGKKLGADGRLNIRPYEV